MAAETTTGVRIEAATQALLDARSNGTDRRLCDAVGYLIAQARESLQPTAEKRGEADPCKGCGAPLDRCGPKLWAEQRKCCPDCSHGEVVVTGGAAEAGKRVAEFFREHACEIVSVLQHEANELEGRHSGYDYRPRVAWLRKAAGELEALAAEFETGKA